MKEISHHGDQQLHHCIIQPSRPHRHTTDASSVTDTEAPQPLAGFAPSSPRSRLRAAAGDGDGKVVKQLMTNEKPNVHAADPATGMTALMLAASARHDDVVLLLTKHLQPQD